MTRVVVSGYFSPAHIGHLNMFEEARMLGDKLIVIVNNDEQQKLKKGKVIINQTERAKMVRAIKGVDDVMISLDNDDTVCKTLEFLKPDVFANGGDRKSDNIPETQVCLDNDIRMVFNVGGSKSDSSSRINKEMGLE